VNDTYLRNAFVAFFNPRTIVPFLFGALCLAVLGNATYQLLTNQLGTDTSAVLAIALGTLACFLLALFAFLWQASRPGLVRPLEHPSRRTPRPRKGLVFLFGRREVCQMALKPHAGSLQRLWLICSPQNNAEANAFAAEIQEAHRFTVEVRVVADANDPLAFHVAVLKILEERPAEWSAEDVISDYVGLTSHASIGMVLACLQARSPIQYTPGEYDANLKAVRPLEPFEVLLRQPIPGAA
jgi:hypothetical protein